MKTESDILGDYLLGASDHGMGGGAVATATTEGVKEKSGSNFEQDIKEENRLNGIHAIEGRKPAYSLQFEKPEHRVICQLKAQAYSNVEISRMLGFTTAMVGYVVNQPWAKEFIAAEIARAGRPMVETLLQSATADAVQTLIEINSDTEARKSDRISAANSLIDRVLGKPRQSMDLTTSKAADKLSDGELLQLIEHGQRN